MRTAGRDRTGRVRALLCWVLAGVGGLSLVGAWALSSPTGSNPDEPAHIYYAWGVVTGQALPGAEQLSESANGAILTEVTVPPRLIEMENVTCYAFDVTATPTCGVSDVDPNQVDPNGDVHRWSYMTRYPPLYYAAVGTVLRAGEVLGLEGPTTLVLARIASGALSLGLVATACVMLARRFGAVATAVAAAVALMPAAWSYIAAVNPNGFEVTSAVLLAACVACVRWDARHAPGVRRGTQVVLVLAAVALAWARPLSIVWAGLLLLLLLLPLPRGADGRRPRWPSGLSWVTVAVAAAGVLSAAGWLLWSTRTRSVEGGDAEAWTSIAPGERVLLIANRFFDMVRDGVSLLGWGDTMLPLSTFLPWLAVGAAAVAALVAGSRDRGTAPRHALAVALGAVAAIGLHSYVSAFGWQGRYLLPVIAACVVLMVPAMQGAALADGRRRRVAVVVLAASAVLMVVSLLWNLGRYAYGYRVFYSRFAQMPLPDGPATWEPLVGVGAVVLAGVLGAALLLVAGVLAVAGDRAEGARPLEPTPPDAGPATATTPASPTSPTTPTTPATPASPTPATPATPVPGGPATQPDRRTAG